MNVVIAFVILAILGMIFGYIAALLFPTPLDLIVAIVGGFLIGFCGIVPLSTWLE